MIRGFASVGTPRSSCTARSVRTARPVRTVCRIAACIVVTLSLSSCAVPVAPTGGPADATPPEITNTEPAEGTTSFRGTQLRITFSEYVNEASFARAFAISPELDQPVDISWRRRTVTLRFQSPLRENTTYRVTVDKGLRDANGVSLSRPLVFAFSTGPEINRARVVGIVRRGPTGAGAGDMDIYAYDATSASLDSTNLIDASNPSDALILPERPLYRTQTNSQGAFELTYLAAGEYYVVGITDRNGNRQPDDGEWVAIPSMRSATASSAEPDSLLLTGYIFDQTPPLVRRARSVSASRIEVRYSEPVVLPLSDDGAFPTTGGWILSDSARTRTHDVTRLYASSSDPSAVFLELGTTEPSAVGSTLRLVTGAVRDSSGNASPIDTVFIAASAVADTSVARLVGVRPVSQPPDTVATLTPTDWPVVELGAPRAPDEWLRVFSRGDNGVLRELPFSSVAANGRSYEIAPELADATRPFAIEVDRESLDSVSPGDTTSTHWFRKLRAGELGGLIAHVDAGSAVATVEYFSAQDPAKVVVADHSGDMTYTASGLRPGRYGVRAYVDYNGDATWTPGRIRPYRAGEPITWVADSVEVRARFDTLLPDTLRIESTPEDEDG